MSVGVKTGVLFGGGGEDVEVEVSLTGEGAEGGEQAVSEVH